MVNKYVYNCIMITTTISLNEDVRHTAKTTEAKQFRGGLSEYVEKLICADLKKKGIDILKAPAKKVKEAKSNVQ